MKFSEKFVKTFDFDQIKTRESCESQNIILYV